MLISVWGNMNSGKSLFSTVMGRILADAGKRALIIYAGLQSNDTPCFYPDEREMVSMGNLWQMDLDDDEMLKYMMATEKDNLAYLTYSPGENIYSYPVFTKYNIVNVLSRLSSFFEYIIVDCSSDLNGGVITLTALEMSDRVIRLMGSSGKAWLYFAANLPMISDSRFNLGSHICVLSDIMSAEAAEVYEKSYENILYRLYHDEKIYQAYLEGQLMHNAGSKYEDIVKKIIAENICSEIKLSGKKKELKAKKPIRKETIKKEKEKVVRENKKRKIGIFKRKEEESDGRYDE